MIFKYKLGGHGPYTTWSESSDSENTTKKQSSEDQDELGIKDILTLVKDSNMLPNDAAYTTEILQSLFQRGMESKSPSFISTMYAKLWQVTQKARHHENNFKNAEKEVTTKKGLAEAAITKDGRFVGKDSEGNLQALSLEQARSGDYQLLTNSELLYLNSEGSAYAFDNSLLEVVENGIGMEYINDLVDKFVSSLGTNEITQEGYSLKDASDIIAGLDFIKEQKVGMPLEGLYKSSTTQKSQKEQINKALSYLYNMLPENAKSLLKLKTGNADKAKELLYNYLGAQSSNTSDFKVDMKEVPGSKSGSGSKDEGWDLNPVMAFVLGRGPAEKLKINVGGSYEISTTGRLSILTKDGKNLGVNSTLADVTYSDFAISLDLDNATFGGVRLNMSQGDRVLLRNANIYHMELPIDRNAQLKGIIKPDLLLTERMEKAEDYIRKHKITGIHNINKVYVDHELKPKYDESGNLNKIDYAVFGRITAQVEESALTEKAKLDKTVREIEDDNVRQAAERIIQASYKKYNMSEGFLGFGVTELYEGAIYIPVRSDVIGASLASGQYFKVNATDDSAVIMDEQAQARKAQGYSKPGSLSSIKQ